MIVQEILTRATTGPLIPGLVRGNDSRAFSQAVKAELKARGYNVASVRATNHGNHRGIRIFIPRAEGMTFSAWCDMIRSPASETLHEILGEDVPYEVVDR